MSLFGGRKKSKNWELVKNRKFREKAANRDVHNLQDMERGEVGVVTKPIMSQIGAVMMGLLFGGMALFVSYVGLTLFAWYSDVVTNGIASSSFSDLEVNMDYKVYVFAFFVFLLSWIVFNQKFLATWRSRNSMADTSDINTKENDQFIMLNEEAQRTYDWFPDTGAHSSVQVSSLLSHNMISKKGLKTINAVRRHKKNQLDTDGNVVSYKGEPVYDMKGEMLRKRIPLIDEAFGQHLFTASDIPVDQKDVRIPYDVRDIEYNPVVATGDRQDRDKLPYDTVGDLINEDWDFPDYEVQPPAGAYLVDTAPVNTMV